jgi:hypothetical protein
MVVLTLAGHTAGGGSVDMLGLAIAATLSLGLAASATRRRITWSRTWIALLAGQALLHVILTFTSGHAHGTTTTNVHAMVLGHVIASLLAAVLVVHADAVMDRWSAYLSAAIGAVAPPFSEPQAPPARPIVTLVASTPALRHMRHRLIRRGPPPRFALSMQ